jgi:hypothetical protein
VLIAFRGGIRSPLRQGGSVSGLRTSKTERLAILEGGGSESIEFVATGQGGGAHPTNLSRTEEEERC